MVRCWLKGINIAFFSENDVESEWTYVVPFLVGKQYKIVLLTYKVLHGMALWCLGPFVRAPDLPSRRALRSASISRLLVPTFKRSAVGGRTFQVSGSRIWNELPEGM